MNLKIYNYTDSPAISLDYKTILNKSLYYDEQLDKGFIVRELFYSDEEKTDLVTEVSKQYFRDEITGIVSHINISIKYLAEEGEDLVLSRTKYLTDRQKIKLLKVRRKTLRETTEAACLEMMKMAMPEKTTEEILKIGASFLITHNTSFDYFEKVGSLQIVLDIQNASDDWLDFAHPYLQGATIRQYLMAQFSS